MNAPIRPTDETWATIKAACEITGMSAPKALGLYVRAGKAALESSPDPKLDAEGVKSVREILKLSAEAKRIEDTHGEVIRRARAAVRKAEQRKR